ncbi:MAG: DNA repair protein RecN, partial [Pikeienuella sp.]
MLYSLDIRDIVLIERQTLLFAKGLNVLTGETGAGKSILLDALAFALGRRDAKGLVRSGAKEGSATATLICPADHPARALMDEAGLAWDDDALTLRRIASADGPSRAFVNDQRVSAATLRAIGETLVEVHGQHDDRGLLNARGHRVLLDAFAGVERELAASRETWRAARAAREALDAAEEAAAEAARDRDYLEHAAKELRDLSPEHGEDEALDTQRRLMQGAERIRDDIVAAAGLVSGGETGAEMLVGDAMRRLDGVVSEAEGRLDAPIEALGRALDAIGDAENGIRLALEALSFDPLELERVEERLFALRALARKHKCPPDALPDLASEMERKLNLISAGEGEITVLRKTVAETAAAYDVAAKALSAKRRAAAGVLDKSVGKELPALKMERARFETAISDSVPGPDGVDQVAFQIATNPGSAAGPLGAIASGGELSRFLLALKVSLAGRGGGGVMIFDEIDRGVGGATANAVGRRLARLAQSAQVMVVTHSPQVAALGEAHFRIEKSVKNGQTQTAVIALPEDQRRDEIARMLSGDTVTAA